MKTENDTQDPSHRSWLERVGDALTREPQDRAQLVALLRHAKQRQLFDADALRMIEGVLQVSELQVRDITIPRSQMVVVSHDAEPSEFLPTIIASGHSRFPVVGESRDEVEGILMAKDLLRFTFEKKEEAFDIRKIMRPAVFIPESKRLNVLLREFRLKRNHIAIVVDEYGGVAGLITIEDVLEQIVGDIEDEFDVEETACIRKTREGQYTVRALTSIEEFNTYFGADLADEAYDTIGGFVTQQFGYLPKRDETVSVERFHFKVLHADSRRIRMLQLTIKDKE